MPKVRVHLTNVTGTGAVRLAESLLPALIASSVSGVSTLYIPKNSALSNLTASWPNVDVVQVRRRLPKAISRFLECVVPSRHVVGSDPLLVLGDLPLRCRARQTLFVQTPHLVSSSSAVLWRDKVKFWVSRFVMRANLGLVEAVIVQTQVMKDAMARAYPTMAPKLHVLAQPVPEWLMPLRSSRSGCRHNMAEGLHLAYPAVGDAHKNHALLGRIPAKEAASWPVASLVLTLEASRNPAPQVGWIRTVGLLEPSAMVDLYAKVDALLFLSLEESYGFPLIEAMFIGIPIVCTDRPYARLLCGNGAIYFDPGSVKSLRSALDELQRRLASGWWPDWREQVARLPTGWQDVADRILKIAVGCGAGSQPVQPLD